MLGSRRWFLDNLKIDVGWIIMADLQQRSDATIAKNPVCYTQQSNRGPCAQKHTFLFVWPLRIHVQNTKNYNIVTTGKQVSNKTVNKRVIAAGKPNIEIIDIWGKFLTCDFDTIHILHYKYSSCTYRHFSFYYVKTI